MSTAALKKRFREAYSRHLSREVVVGQRLHNTPFEDLPTLAKQGIHTRPLAKLVAKYAKQGDWNRHRVAMRLFTGCHLTSVSAAERIQVDPLPCQLCQGRDDMVHRVAECPSTHRLRHLLSVRQHISKLVTAGENSAWLRCDWQPRVRHFHRGLTIRLYSTTKFDSEGVAPFLPLSGGDLFTDGSQFNNQWPELACAGAAILQLDQQGVITRAILITLPISVQQDAAVAVQVAAVMAVLHSEPGVNIWTDCEAVLANALDPAKAQHYRTRAADIWRRATGAQFRSWGKVEAHRSFRVAIIAGQFQLCRGNTGVDLVAKDSALFQGPDVYHQARVKGAGQGGRGGCSCARRRDDPLAAGRL